MFWLNLHSAWAFRYLFHGKLDTLISTSSVIRWLRVFSQLFFSFFSNSLPPDDIIQIKSCVSPNWISSFLYLSIIWYARCCICKISIPSHNITQRVSNWSKRGITFFWCFSIFFYLLKCRDGARIINTNASTSIPHWRLRSFAWNGCDIWTIVVIDIVVIGDIIDIWIIRLSPPLSSSACVYCRTSRILTVWWMCFGLHSLTTISTWSYRSCSRTCIATTSWIKLLSILNCSSSFRIKLVFIINKVVNQVSFISYWAASFYRTLFIRKAL